MEALQSQLIAKKENKYLSKREERLLLPHMPLQFDDLSSPSRQNVEHYIADSFHSSYQAEVTEFLPYLLSTHTNGKLIATIGFQPAATKHPLFLEQYITSNIELELSRLINESIKRNQIIEVGNLTSGHRGMASQILFILSVAILHQAGFKWVTFTATKQVQSLLDKLKLVPVEICEASPDNLVDKGVSWGSYYDDTPKVLAGNLADAIAQLNTHKVIRFILDSYKNDITNIANQLKVP